MAAIRFMLLLIMIFPYGLFGQSNRYVVFFKDKTNSPYSIDQPEAFLSARSLARRAKQDIAITEIDLPVNPAYVSQVKLTGARSFFRSRWMNCLLVEVGADSVDILQALPMVSGVERVAPGNKLMGGRIRKLQDNRTGSGAATSMAQLIQLGIDQMQSEGFNGENISVAILDGGFPGVNSISPFQHLFENGQIRGSVDFVGNTGNVYQYHWHGTAVLSVIAGNIAGSFSGGAPAANFYLYVTEDVLSEYRIEEYNWLFAAEHADSAGVDIISTSLGYNEFDDVSMDYSVTDLDGKTAVITRAANQAMQSGMVVVCSAGNEGNVSWHFVTPPADATGILSVGAVDENGFRAPFSSVGPTADNRIKPDVVALGVGNVVITDTGMISSINGTSLACPLISSLAAGVWQAYPGLSAKRVYHAIIQSADQAHNPDNLRGYGLPNFAAAKDIIESEADITIHPNPVATAFVNVTVKKPTQEPCTITIYDCLGQTLSSSVVTLSSQENQLSLSGLSPGMYFIQFKSQSLSITVKLIKV